MHTSYNRLFTQGFPGSWLHLLGSNFGLELSATPDPAISLHPSSSLFNPCSVCLGDFFHMHTELFQWGWHVIQVLVMRALYKIIVLFLSDKFSFILPTWYTHINRATFLKKINDPINLGKLKFPHSSV